FVNLRINVIDAAIFGFSQCCGLVIGRLFSIKRSGERIPRRIDQAVWVLSGALLIGPVILCGIVMLFALLVFMLSTALWCPPFFLAVGGYALLRYWRGKWSRR